MTVEDAEKSRKHDSILLQIDANLVNNFSGFPIGYSYLQQSIKFHWLKSWQLNS